ncbi:camphor resistance protein CrcB [Orbus hercynius]|uniref:Fluoride-specific ion channel FluC n=1 Tax=Orbus hercynius TaxID=593135 RepID=A0A495RIY9_9GAMM|nr:fluoride efflux transporter CrcB [Orbus hercynius]RKS87502.1 camphor resistance protein CrcB [Orbus hercynius]
MLKAIIAIAIGSAAGGILRWILSNKFNHYYTIPFGTLLSNLIAGYIIGFAMSLLSNFPSISPEWRLLIITGFCGGLSTFSTFSAEIVNFLQKGQITLGISAIAIHVIGSIIMTILGILTYQLIKQG